MYPTGMLSCYITTSCIIHYRILVYQEDGDFSADAPKLEGWTHVVINYLNPDVGHKVYFNGTEVSQGSRTPRHIPAGDGRLVVGRAYTNEDRDLR